MQKRPWQAIGSLLFLGVILQASSGGAHLRATKTVADLVSIGGEVKDTIGQPIPGVRVVMVPERGGPPIHTTTDRDGAYRVVGVSEETYRLDFTLYGFSGSRHNHVRPVSNGQTRVDAVLSIRAVCECINFLPDPQRRKVPGQVVNEADQPLPHARLELVGSGFGDAINADAEGRFVVSPPVEGTARIVATDSGFAPATEQISGAMTTPLILRLKFTGTQGLPDTEVFNRRCPCSQYFAVEESRDRD